MVAAEIPTDSPAGRRQQGVLVVRSAPGLARTVAAVRALGVAEVVGLAISAPEALAVSAPMGVDGVVFTSAQAVRRAKELGVADGVPAWCVGEATAGLARACGWPLAGVGTGDAAGLVPLLGAAGPGRHWWHMHGDNAGLDWHTAVRGQGQRMSHAIGYRTVFTDVLDPVLAAGLRGGRWRQVMLMSAQSAGHLLRLLDAARIEPRQMLPVACALSEAVAEVARPAFAAVRVAAQPSLAGMLEIVGRE